MPDPSRASPVRGLSEALATFWLMGFFAVRLRHGPSWDDSRGVREQDAWPQHAAFMDGLVSDGFIYMGGPLGDGGGDGALHIVEAVAEEDIRHRLSADPWVPRRLLEIDWVASWSVWLDGR